MPSSVVKPSSSSAMSILSDLRESVSVKNEAKVPVDIGLMKDGDKEKFFVSYPDGSADDVWADDVADLVGQKSVDKAARSKSPVGIRLSVDRHALDRWLRKYD